MTKIRILPDEPTKVIKDGKVMYKYKAKVEQEQPAEKIKVPVSVYEANGRMIKRGIDAFNSMTEEEKRSNLEQMSVPN